MGHRVETQASTYDRRDSYKRRREGLEFTENLIDAPITSNIHTVTETSTNNLETFSLDLNESIEIDQNKEEESLLDMMQQIDADKKKSISKVKKRRINGIRRSKKRNGVSYERKKKKFGAKELLNPITEEKSLEVLKK